MATSKAVEKKTENVEVESLPITEDQAPKEPTLEDGIYTEYAVELGNGVKVDIEVVFDREELPASYMSLVAEGNMEAALIAQLTPRTRRILDLVGATLKDLKSCVLDVVGRAQKKRDEAGDS